MCSAKLMCVKYKMSSKLKLAVLALEKKQKTVYVRIIM